LFSTSSNLSRHRKTCAEKELLEKENKKIKRDFRELKQQYAQMALLLVTPKLDSF
jgi:hypothetical protein